MQDSHYIGLMSGTSLDGVDGVLAHFAQTGKLQILAHVFIPFSATYRDELLALNTRGDDELHRSALAGNTLSRIYAKAVENLCLQTGITAAQISAIGAHGQTVRHRPLEFDADPAHGQAAVGYTLQLINPSLLAELTGIDVVADFRSRDLAAGGQGAPLVPVFHQGIFGQTAQCVAVLNIGGISNLSVIKTDGSVLGWDCGPGNALMDFWCDRHTGEAFDRDGEWAASGQLNTELLFSLASESFLAKPPPKSTGRDLFNPSWLFNHIAPFPSLKPADIQATLCAFTAFVCSQDILRHAPESSRLVVCGGGALNGELMRQMAMRMPKVAVMSCQVLGISPLQVEAAAFAWLAFKTVRRETASLPSVTGARGARVLGAVYPR